MGGGAFPVPLPAWQSIRLDPRYAQIATLSGLLAMAMLVYQTGAGLAQLASTLAAGLLTQTIAARAGAARFDWRSAAIPPCR